LTINKKNFRSTLVALAFGALVTVLPASADTISLAIVGTPTNILVGGQQWTFSGGTISPTALPGAGLTLNGGTIASEIGNLAGSGNSGATATHSEVIDVKVTPTIDGGAAAAVTFQGTIREVGGVYSLYFGNNGTTGCSNPANTTACFVTANGNVVNNGQTIAGNYTVLSSGGMNYEVQTTTTLSASKPFNFLNGFVGVVVAPEPATYATTGFAIAFLGLFLRRKAQKS
jgi:hypothetical protein